MTTLQSDETFQGILRCPVCGSGLARAQDDQFQCLNPECATQFPIVDGVPILINEARSVFSIQDFVAQQDTFLSTKGGAMRKLRKLLPSISANVDSDKHYRRFVELLLVRDKQQVHSNLGAVLRPPGGGHESPVLRTVLRPPPGGRSIHPDLSPETKYTHKQPRVLIVGGGIAGQGMDDILFDTPIQFLETDVSLGPRTAMVCDAHDLPFADASFDGVIAQAVLEHVVDPYRCVSEIQRVLGPGGLVYAETPFMQQVHGGRYDFTRFTHLGHRRLFRHFAEVESGAVCGPGMALAWSYRYFLLSFVDSPMAMRLVDAFAHLTSFWLKYFDRYLITKPGALDAASGYYFLGRKNEYELSDRDLLTLYRGQM